MALRMVLVSFVASLGLSLPTSEDMGRWTKSTRNWLDSRLAAWDARMPSGTQAFVYYAESDFPDTAAVNESPKPASEAETTAEKNLADLEDVLGDDFNEEATLATETTTPAIISDADFAAAMNDVVVTFTADLAPATTTPAAVAVAVAETPKTTEVEPATEISDKLAEEMASLFKTETQNLMESSKPAPPLFEPMVVAENLDNDFAYELNRKSDGRELHEIAVSPSSTESTPATADRVIRAFRLTREAALAWANLLHAPAVVTIGH